MLAYVGFLLPSLLALLLERDDLPRTPRTAGPRGHRGDGDDRAALAYASDRPGVSIKPAAGVLGFGLTVV
jgi:hypothetical protein